MYLSEIHIKGYKIFKEEFIAKLNKGLTVIVGENGTGKSAIIDAIRVLLTEDEFGRIGIGESDFHRELTKEAKEKGVDKIFIQGSFASLDEIEQVAYLPWLNYNDNSKATLNVEIENKEDAFGKYRWNKWGNETKSGVFEAELVEAIRCIYLPPLRNAPEKLQAYRGSRLARLIRNITNNDKTKQAFLEEQANQFNKELLKNDEIQKIDKIIKEKVIDAVGSVFGQDAMIQFSEVNFNRIIERLKLLFYPNLSLRENNGNSIVNKDKMFRELDENSLGYNNILYLATVLAELEGLKKEETFLKILLIEEPEAHLHAQVQQVFIKKAYEILRNHTNLKNSKIFATQLIVSTHSSHIAHEIDFKCLRYFRKTTYECGYNLPCATVVNLSQTFGTEVETEKFVTRYLKLTHCDLLFADAAILVEGPAEKILIPDFIKQNYPLLDSKYITLLEIGGSHAHRFKALIDNLKIITLIVTDVDSKDGNNKKKQPERNTTYKTGNNSLKTWIPQKENLIELLDLKDEEKISENSLVRIAYQYPFNVEFIAGQSKEFIPYTFEDALVFSNMEIFKNWSNAKGLIKKMQEALNKTTIEEASTTIFDALEDGKKAEMALELLFIDDTLTPPQYIADGLKWMQDKLNIELRTNVEKKNKLLTQKQELRHAIK